MFETNGRLYNVICGVLRIKFLTKKEDHLAFAQSDNFIPKTQIFFYFLKNISISYKNANPKKDVAYLKKHIFSP